MNMWKTVAMRIRGAKTELEEAGLETEGMASSTSALRKEIESLTGGFDIMIDDDTFKSTYDIILGISKIYDKLTDTSQANILEMLAGKRQGNSLAAAFSNAEDLVKVLETSQQSSGSVLKEQESYTKGIQYSTDRIKASLQEMSSVTLDSSTVKLFVDLANVAINATTAVGGLVPVLATLGVGFGIYKFLIPILTKEMSGLLLAETGVTATTLSQIVAQTGLNGAFTLGSVAVKGFITSMLPLAIVTGVVIAIGVAFDHLNVSLKEQKEITANLSSEYDELKSKLESINTELKTTTDRITELLAKDTLTFVEQAELETLKESNIQLQTQNRLLEEQAKIKQRDLADSVSKEFDKDMNNSGEKRSLTKTRTVMGGGRATAVAVNVSEVEYVKEILDAYQKLEKIDKSLMSEEDVKKMEDYRTILVDTGAKYGQYLKDYKIDDETSQSWKDFSGLIDKTLNPAEYKTMKFNELLDTSSFKSELTELAKQGKLTAETLNDPKYANLVSKLSEIGVSASDATNEINSLNVATASSPQTSSFALTAEEITSLNEKLQTATKEVVGYQSLLQTLSENGLNADAQKEIIDNYSDLIPYMNDEVKLREQINSKLEETKTKANEAYAELMKNDSSFYVTALENNSNYVNTLNSQYGVNLSDYKTLAQAKATIEQKLLRALSSAWANYYSIQADASGKYYATIAEEVSSIDEGSAGQGEADLISSVYREADTKVKELNKMSEQLNKLATVKLDFNYTPSKTSPSSKSSSEKSQFQKEIDLSSLAISKLDSKLISLQSQLDDTFSTDYVGKYNIIAQMVDANEEKLEGYQKYLKAFTSKANEELTKIPESIRNLVKNGSVDELDISENTYGKNAENIANAISSYQSYISQAEDLQKTISGIDNTISSLNLDIFANSATKFDDSLTSAKNGIEDLDNALSLLSDNDYDSRMGEIGKQADISRTLIQKYKDEITRLNTTSSTATMATTEFKDRIRELSLAQAQATISAREYEKSIQDIVRAQKQAKLDTYNEQKDALAELVDMTKELIQQETEDQVNGLEKVIDEYEKEKDLIDDQIDALNKELDIHNENIELQREIVDTYEDQKDLIDDKIDALNEELSTYQEIINKQKESLGIDKNQSDYKKELDEKKKSVSDVQENIIIISNDTSREGLAKRRELESELAIKQAELQEFLDNDEYERKINALDAEYANFEDITKDKIGLLEGQQDVYDSMIKSVTDNLDKESKAFEKMIKGKINLLEGQKLVYDGMIKGVNANIDSIQAKIANNGDLTRMAFERIDQAGDTLYKDLIAWNDLYGSTITTDITNPWLEAQEALKDYKSILDAINSTNSNVSNLTADMKQDEINNNASNSSYSNTSSKTPTTSTKNSDGYDEDVLIAQMKRNSAAWAKSTSQSERDNLSNINNAIGTGMGWTRNDKSGIWYDKNGKQAYANGTTSAKRGWANIDEEGNELLIRNPSQGRYSYMEDGDGVIPADATKNLFKWGEITPNNFMQNMMNQLGNISSIPSITNNNTEMNPVTVQLGGIHIGGDATESTIKALNNAGAVIESNILKTIQKQFKKQGI